jgi:phosphate transport system permease protein
MLPLIEGSLVVTAGAVVLALPLGLACAIYLAELSPAALRGPLKSAVELLAGIPSVVLGFIGLTVLAPWLKEHLGLPSGLTAFTGALILAFMALPTVISISEDALAAVPREYKQGSLALGATELQTIWRSSIPAARSGLLAAAMLGVGRAVGETMAVMMVTGNAAVQPSSLLQQVRTMTATIAAEMGETVHYSPHYHALFFLGFLLFLITFLINTVSDVALRRMRR